MSIRPVTFNADGSVEVWHDERSHGGTVAAASIRFLVAESTGAEDIRFLTLPCPAVGCGSVSTHPAGGGADPDRVQRLFARMYQRNVTSPALTGLDTWTAAKGKVQEVVGAMDGPGRYRLEGVAENG